MGTDWVEMIRTFALLALTFVLGEFAVVGIQMWLVDRNGKLGRNLNLGTLVLGLSSVPTLLVILALLIRGP
ncbi:MAG: hypothetical protein RML46_09640 [Anaerolineae bacterium]|nr:hypothetical protein [Anaerolineae bacterium]